MINDVIYELDDGDESTNDITELHGKLAEDADNELVDFAYTILVDRNYKVIVLKGAYEPKRRKNE